MAELECLMTVFFFEWLESSYQQPRPRKKTSTRAGGVAVASVDTSCLRAVPQSRILGLAFFRSSVHQRQDITGADYWLCEVLNQYADMQSATLNLFI